MAMNKQRRTSNISNIFTYDDAGNLVIKDYGQTTRYSWNGTLHAFVGGASVSSIPAATTDTDKFLVSDGGVLKYRTGAQLLSDIGAQSFDGNGFVKMSGTTVTYDNSTYLTTTDATSYYVPYSGATTDVNLNTKNILLGQGTAGSYILMVGNRGTNYLQIENAGSRSRYQMDSLVFTSKQYGGTKTIYFNTNASTGTDYTISFPDKNGTVAMTSDIVAGVTGTGTTNYLPKWTNSTTLGNSIIDDDGTSASVNCTTGGGFYVKYNSAIKLVLTGGTTFGSVDIPVGLDFKIRPDSAEGITVFSNGNTFFGASPINAGFKVDIGGTIRVSTTSTNNIGVFSGVEPNISIVALGASNSAALFLSPSAGFNGGIHNRTGGGLEFYTGATPTLSATITATNNLLVGTGIDEGYRAQVYGTMYTKTAGFVSNLDSTINHALYATGQLLTSAASNGMIYLDTTWNTTGNPSAIYLNVTNTASGSFAKLLDLRVGVSAMFQVDKAGGILTGQPTGGTQGVWKLGQYNTTAPSATGYVEVEINGVLYKLLAST